jgi:hypothetical protein
MEDTLEDRVDRAIREVDDLAGKLLGCPRDSITSVAFKSCKKCHRRRKLTIESEEYSQSFKRSCDCTKTDI